ncbi:MAG: CbtA family protein [Nitrosarchaeum sp.]|nr:CbtA family protein [Nitrosarchaeum sp.]MDW7641897.1 CbtA family protein [Nitrosarchaeum sp.]
MRSFLFVLIVLISGSASGMIYGSLNLLFVEPLLDQAILIENQQMFASGKEKDTPEFWTKYDEYRIWQKSGQVFAGVIYGISLASLFGIIFVFSQNSLPGKDIKKSIILGLVIWIVIYLIPFLKYPANPPTVGEPETIVLRGILYLSFIAISGFSALVFYKIYKKLKTQKFLAVLAYLFFIAIVLFVMPGNPDKITAPLELVEHFRIISVLTMTTYWISLGFIFGYLWYRFKPDKEIPRSI